MAGRVSLMHASVKIGTLLPAACHRCSLLASGLVYQSIPPLVTARFYYVAATLSTFVASAQCWVSSRPFWCPWCMSLGAPWVKQPNKISVEFCMWWQGINLSADLSDKGGIIIHATSASSLINGPMFFLPAMLCQMVPKYRRHGYMYLCNVALYSHVSVCLLFSMSSCILLPILSVRGLYGIHHMHVE